MSFLFDDMVHRWSNKTVGAGFPVALGLGDKKLEVLHTLRVLN